MAGGLRYGIETRSAHAADAAEIGRLVSQAGAAIAVQDVAERLEALRVHPAAAVLVATGYAGLSGVVVVEWAPCLLHPRPVARLPVLAVDAEERRRGIGRMLLKAASQVARQAGCDIMEMAVPAPQQASLAFCQETGFTQHGAVMRRVLRKKA